MQIQTRAMLQTQSLQTRLASVQSIRLLLMTMMNQALHHRRILTSVWLQLTRLRQSSSVVSAQVLLLSQSRISHSVLNSAILGQILIPIRFGSRMQLRIQVLAISVLHSHTLFVLIPRLGRMPTPLLTTTRNCLAVATVLTCLLVRSGAVHRR